VLLARVGGLGLRERTGHPSKRSADLYAQLVRRTAVEGMWTLQFRWCLSKMVVIWFARLHRFMVCLRGCLAFL
jgi:hypothetical protein